MADYPDLYTDGFAISVSPFGVTLTFQLSQPSLEPGPHVDAGEIVARIRLSPALANALSQGLVDAVAQQANVQAEGTVRH
jgi:hypothetical protein